MKKIFLALGLLTSSFLSFSQSFEKGNFLISAGVGIGYYGTKSFINGEQQKNEDNTAGNINYPITVQYGVSDKFSLGIKIQPANWGDDPDDNYEATNKSGMFALLGEYHIKNTGKSDLYTRLSVGAITWNQTKTAPGEKQENKYTGINFRPSLGYRLYFGNTIGLYWDIAYSYYGMKLKEASFNGDDFDLSSTELEIKTSGIEVTFIGVTVKL